MSTIDNLKKKAYDIMTNRQLIMILGISFIFIGVIFWVYGNYIAPKINPDYDANNEYIYDKKVEDEDKYVTITMFKTSWCPYCKAALDTDDGGWTMAKKTTNINGYTINWEVIDGETEEKKMKAFEKKYNVEIDGYPTIFLIKGDNIIEFNSQITQEKLTTFISTSL
jgi:glutaredoxin|tara:strand:+ start:1249 stop:1749 length:501 start_codon:yes stop_codon:yes gene_type:complete